MSADNPKLCEIKCRKCGCLRRFPISSEYKLWLDDPRSVKDRLSIDSLLVKYEPPKLTTSKRKKAATAANIAGGHGTPEGMQGEQPAADLDNT